MPLLQPPAATAFDAVSSLASAAVYVIVALMALIRAPHDARVRVFFAVALSGVPPYCLTALIWRQGAQIALARPMVVLVGLSLMAGSLALLHFTQVFPWRRPWIRAHAAWLWWGYAAAALLTGVAALVTPSFDLSDAAGLGTLSESATELAILAVLAVAVPVLVVVGVIVPFCGVLSLYKSWLTARAHHADAARLTTMWMLISQMGGGVLTILIIPLLRIIAPDGPWVTLAAALLFACSLLMPIAFALGVWRWRVLELTDSPA